MNTTELINKHPFLYHLTDRQNWAIILQTRKLLSTKEIVNSVLPPKEAKQFLRRKRDQHEKIVDGQISYKIRDQRPISIKVLDKSLFPGIDSGDFLEILNERVFWWPTIKRLDTHYQRYKSEGPIIIRAKTEDILSLNSVKVELCHLNSGATRCHPKHGCHAPTRGRTSFVGLSNYTQGPNTIAEVTVVGNCDLPVGLWTGDSPGGPWTLV